MQKLHVRSAVYRARSTQLSPPIILPRQHSPTLLRTPRISASFSTTPHLAAGSPLFHLASLSNARETQWASKASGLSRVEHSTNLQLLRSEAELCPADPLRPTEQRGKRRVPAASPTLSKVIGDHLGNGTVRQTLVRRVVAVDDKALSIGRAILQRHAQQVQRFRRLVRKTQFSHKKEVQSLELANRQLSKDNRAGSLWILLTMGIATGLALWRFSPTTTAVGAGKWREKWRVADPAPSGAESDEMTIVPAEAVVMEEEPPAKDLVYVETKVPETSHVGGNTEDLRPGKNSGGWRRRFWAE